MTQSATQGVEVPLQIARVSAARPAAVTERARGGPIAVFVAHGMGQQAKFETLDLVASGLVEACGTAAPVRARTVHIGEQKLQRLELSIPRAAGTPLDVHVYEGYWAPLTEGKVTLRDVTSFLFNAGANGLRNSLGHFKRWMFDQDVDFGRQPATVAYLLVTLLVVLSLVVMNAVIASVVSGDVIAQLTGTMRAQAVTAMRARLSTALVGYVVVSLVLGLGIGVALRIRPRRPGQRIAWRSSAALLQVLFWLWTAATIVVGVAFAADRVGWRVPRFLPITWQVSGDRLAWLWVALAGVTWIVRRLLVQYVGDVAAYVSSHRLDRFNALRQKIKKTVTDAARAVYAAADAHGEYLYSRVLVVGHSLGSVIVYDALNALLIDDDLAGSGAPLLRVADRTGLLLTFGSPLDKVAFIFARAGASANQRAAAASVQPLIQDYARFRRMPWINLYSRRDIISGRLDFFDAPDAGPDAVRRVRSIRDEDALVPLAAHLEYWRNPALFEALRAHLVPP